MSNFTKNEIESIEKFFKAFVDSAQKTLAGSLDKDVYKKIEFFVSSTSDINSVEALNDGKMIYKLDYSKGGLLGGIMVLLPEELVANISDVLTGGEGNSDFEGTLGELEINSIKDLAKKVFDQIEGTFKRVYTNDFGFSTDPLILTKEAPNYVNEFAGAESDFLIELTLRVNGEREYAVSMLLNSGELRQVLTNLDVFGSDSSERLNVQSNINIDHLADIKIDISAELGKASIPVKYALELVRGSLVKLDTIDGSDIKVFANNVEVARAQIVVVGDSFGLRITKIISPEERAKLV